MTLWFNIILAWTAWVLSGLLAVIWPLRVFTQKKRLPKGHPLARIHRVLRRHHKSLGTGMVAAGLAHGLLSSQEVWHLNFGTLVLVLGILLGLVFFVRKRFRTGRGWIRWHRGLTLAFFTVLALHLVEVEGFVGMAALQEALREAPPATIYALPEGNVYADGVYRGEATGYREGLVVSVTVKDNLITAIEVVSHHEVGERFYEKAILGIPPAVLEAQSLQVDAVSGATRTSTGILNAVGEALNEALIEGELIQDEVLAQSPTRGGGKGKNAAQKNADQ